MEQEIDRVLEQIADPAERADVAADALADKYTRKGREYPVWIGQSHVARIMAALDHGDRRGN